MTRTTQSRFHLPRAPLVALVLLVAACGGRPAEGPAPGPDPAADAAGEPAPETESQAESQAEPEPGPVPEGDSRVEGRLLDAETGEPVSRRTVYVHFIGETIWYQTSLDPEDASTYRAEVPRGHRMRVRVYDTTHTYHPFEQVVAFDDEHETFDVALQPTLWVTLHGRVVAADTGRVIAREPGGSDAPGGHGPLFYFSSEGENVHKGAIAAGADGTYSLKVPRGKIEVGAVDTAKRLVQTSIDLTGYEGDAYEHDLRLE